MSWRLLAVSALALAMGLVFGGLRVATAASTAASFGRVSQLATLGQQVTVLVQALENERDQTTGIAPVAATTTQLALLQPAYDATNTAAASVRTLATGIGASFPANIQAKVATVLSAASNLHQTREIAQISQSALSVVAAYATPINAMISLNDQIAQGTSDAALANDVQALNSLALAKDEASQQRALMDNALLNHNFADGELQALTTAQSVQATDKTAFGTTATPAERSAFFSRVGGLMVSQAESIEILVFGNGAVDADTITAGGYDPKVLPQTWYTDMSATVDGMQAVEQQVAANIVARAQQLQQGAASSAVLTAVLTVIILLIVAIATLLVTRSLVRPLRRLRADALDIASVQLPERVRRLGESADAAASLDIVPIDVTSGDEIGQVARAFDRVHAEAVRLAGNEALLRTSYNAMFVNLSRRSQALIERLVRMIDSLEQNEDDPSRLSNLFAMDHLVTRMRRNSENLLLLAGHEPARKRSEPVPLTDVARAAISEIEQYSRVTLNIQQGVSLAGSAVSDVVHLLAEVVENATTFSPRDTPVHMTAQQVSSGGVLVEVADNGVGIPGGALAELNDRLDNPPVMDVSVSRHMGLFAVARLAERHGIRVRLRARPPQGIIAMVWLPDTIILQGDRPFGRLHPAMRHIGVPGRRPGGASRASLPAQPALPTPAPEPVSPRPAGRTAPVASSKWFTDPHAGPNDVPRVPAAASMTANQGYDAQGNGGHAYDAQGNGGHAYGEQGYGEQGNGGHGYGGHGYGEQGNGSQGNGEQTRSGLPVRVPRANLAPGLADTTRRTDITRPSHQPDHHESPSPHQQWAHRTPDIARSRLSGFQRGVRRGKSQTPSAGEGIDR